jgi:hypothetical protein
MDCFTISGTILDKAGNGAMARYGWAFPRLAVVYRRGGVECDNDDVTVADGKRQDCEDDNGMLTLEDTWAGEDNT